MHDISTLAHVKSNVVIFNGRRCCAINMLIRRLKNLNDHCPINYDGMSPCLMFRCSAIRPPPMPLDFHPTHA
jgi:hypothetical protein